MFNFEEKQSKVLRMYSIKTVEYFALIVKKRVAEKKPEAAVKNWGHCIRLSCLNKLIETY